MQSKHNLKEPCEPLFFYLCAHEDHRGHQQSASCHPFGVLLIQTQRNCQRVSDAWLNTDVLHLSWIESNRGIYRCRCAPPSVWLSCPSSSPRHLDVSHPQCNAQSLPHHKIIVPYIACASHFSVKLFVLWTQRGARFMLTPACWLLLSHSLYQNTQSKGQK